MNIRKILSRILYYAHSKIYKTYNINTLQKVETRLLGKQGTFNKVLKLFKYNHNQTNGVVFFYKSKNILKQYIKQKYKQLLNNIYKYIDLSLPGRTINIGNLHPITININNIKTFFFNLGFNLVDGPEIVNCFNNFDALNIHKNHPARSVKDSFWIIKNYLLLRTHTTSVQIRMMKNKLPPIKSISIGKVYRYDNDNTHTPMFHQLEGLLVDKTVSICNLKTLIIKFLLYYFNNNDFKIRFRPSYFPFTEPSIEVDIYNSKYNQWVEVLGCGLLHQNILQNVGINTNKYHALAFGIGIERLIMLKYNIHDLRILYENNLRFLNKFKYIK